MRNKGSLMHMLAAACQGGGGGEEGWSDCSTGLRDLGPSVTSQCLSFLNCEVPIQQSFKNMYLFIWLHQVLVAPHGLFAAAHRLSS